MRRRWLDHPVPKLRQVAEGRRADIVEGGAEVAVSSGSLTFGIALTVAVVLVVFVVLPVLGLALELILLVAIVGFGLIGRLAFHRPWIVEAVNLDHPQRSAKFGVRGWGESGRAVAQLSTTIQVSGVPGVPAAAVPGPGSELP